MPEVDLFEWVKSAKGSKEQNSVVHILLHAIGNNESLRTTMIMKGGNLLGIRHASKRYTKDVDFSTDLKFKDFNEQKFREELNDSLISAAGELGYTFRCWVQRTEIEPNPNGTFPTLRVNVGYANYTNPKEKKFIDSENSPKVLKIDYSFNEATYNPEVINLSDESSIIAYSIIDIVAEKIRSVLQQAARDRNREQDIYDLNFIIGEVKFDDEAKFNILQTLIKKSVGKEIDAYLNSGGLDQDDIKSRSKERYPRLSETVPDLLDFEESYETVNNFFKSLPWDIV